MTPWNPKKKNTHAYFCQLSTWEILTTKLTKRKMKTTRTTRAMVSTGGERDLGWSRPPTDGNPPSATRRLGFTDLLDIHSEPSPIQAAQPLPPPPLDRSPARTQQYHHPVITNKCPHKITPPARAESRSPLQPTDRNPPTQQQKQKQRQQQQYLRWKWRTRRAAEEEGEPPRAGLGFGEERGFAGGRRGSEASEASSGGEVGGDPTR